jgi:hypothetical protein
MKWRFCFCAVLLMVAAGVSAAEEGYWVFVSNEKAGDGECD